MKINPKELYFKLCLAFDGRDWLKTNQSLVPFFSKPCRDYWRHELSEAISYRYKNQRTRKYVFCECVRVCISTYSRHISIWRPVTTGSATVLNNETLERNMLQNKIESIEWTNLTIQVHSCNNSTFLKMNAEKTSDRRE